LAGRKAAPLGACAWGGCFSKEGRIHGRGARRARGRHSSLDRARAAAVARAVAEGRRHSICVCTEGMEINASVPIPLLFDTGGSQAEIGPKQTRFAGEGDGESGPRVSIEEEKNNPLPPPIGCNQFCKYP